MSLAANTSVDETRAAKVGRADDVAEAGHWLIAPTDPKNLLAV